MWTDAELISPLRRRSIPAWAKVCHRGEDNKTAQMFTLSAGQTQPFWLPATSRRGRIRGGWKEGNNRTQHFLEQAFSFWCHNISPFPYISISTNTRSAEKTEHKRKWKFVARSILVWGDQWFLGISDSLASAKMSSSARVHADGLKRKSLLTSPCRLWMHTSWAHNSLLTGTLHFFPSIPALRELDLTCFLWRNEWTRSEPPH